MFEGLKEFGLRAQLKFLTHSVLNTYTDLACRARVGEVVYVKCFLHDKKIIEKEQKFEKLVWRLSQSSGAFSVSERHSSNLKSMCSMSRWYVLVRACENSHVEILRVLLTDQRFIDAASDHPFLLKDAMDKAHGREMVGMLWKIEGVRKAASESLPLASFLGQIERMAVESSGTISRSVEACERGGVAGGPGCDRTGETASFQR